MDPCWSTPGQKKRKRMRCWVTQKEKKGGGGYPTMQMFWGDKKEVISIWGGLGDGGVW